MTNDGDWSICPDQLSESDPSSSESSGAVPVHLMQSTHRTDGDGLRIENTISSLRYAIRTARTPAVQESTKRSLFGGYLPGQIWREN